jgi:hypothetical protein
VNLRWKFWRRNKHTATAVVPTPEPALPVSPFTSGKELLGLQRTIGNQAVLELLALRQHRTQTAAQERAHLSFQHKSRRN